MFSVITALNIIFQTYIKNFTKITYYNNWVSDVNACTVREN